MKLKRFRNKFISMLLTLAMLLTLFPTAVFAEDTAADRPASAEFKIMGLYALRDNGRWRLLAQDGGHGLGAGVAPEGQRPGQHLV